MECNAPGASIPIPEGASRILTVGLSYADWVSLVRILTDTHWVIEETQCCERALESLRVLPARVLLCEAQMPDGDWSGLLERLGSLAARPALVVVSRLADERLWADVLSLGGYDVLAVPFDYEEARRVLYLALHSWDRQTQTRRIGPKRGTLDQAFGHRRGAAASS